LPILVLGGTGHYGRHIVERLIAKGTSVRVLSRNVERARELLGGAPELVSGDLSDGAVVARALDGASGMVVSVSGVSRKQIRRVEAIERDAVIAALRMAEDRQVERAVVISTYDLREGVGPAAIRRIGAGKLAVERHLAQSKLNWTVLGVPPSMEIFLAMVRGRTMAVPGGGPPILPTVSPVDVGEVAAQAVLRRDLAGQRLRVAGPDTIGFAEAARRLSAVYGYPIRYRRLPIFPVRLGYWLTWPLARVSDLALYLHTMLGFIQLMNRFPQDLAAQAPADHQRLLGLFSLLPHTLEMEARRRQARTEGATKGS
jgi:uncharacterized protein YbjT (DUF2867 family)